MNDYGNAYEMVEGDSKVSSTYLHPQISPANYSFGIGVVCYVLICGEKPKYTMFNSYYRAGSILAQTPVKGRRCLSSPSASGVRYIAPSRIITGRSGIKHPLACTRLLA